MICISQRETESGGETEVRPTLWRREEVRVLNYSRSRKETGPVVFLPIFCRLRT